jgi:hypothetical protein
VEVCILFPKLSVLRGRTEFYAGRQQGGSKVQEMGCTGGTGGRRTVPRISLKNWEKIGESVVWAVGGSELGISASVWYLRLARRRLETRHKGVNSRSWGVSDRLGLTTVISTPR